MGEAIPPTGATLEELVSLLGVASVAAAVQTSSATVEGWLDGVDPPGDSCIVIEDLRVDISVLRGSGMTDSEIREWLVSPNDEELKGRRPIDCVAENAIGTLTAANAFVHQRASRD